MFYVLSTLEAVASITIVKGRMSITSDKQLLAARSPWKQLHPGIRISFAELRYIFFNQRKPLKVHHVEKFAVFYVHIVYLQNLQATGWKVHQYQDGHKNILHSCSALPFIKYLYHLISFYTSPMDGTCTTKILWLFFCVMLSALFYLSRSKSKVIHFLREEHSEAAVTTCFSRQTPAGALMPVSFVTGIHFLSWTLMTYVLCQVLSSGSTGTHMTMTS